ELFARLGVAEQVRSKSQRIAGERVAAVVARADAEIGFQQISELLPVPGVDYVGPLPEALQRVTLFSAGVVSRSPNLERAGDLIRFYASPDAHEVIRRLGLEPPAPSRVPPAQRRSRSRYSHRYDIADDRRTRLRGPRIGISRCAPSRDNLHRAWVL